MFEYKYQQYLKIFSQRDIVKIETLKYDIHLKLKYGEMLYAYYCG